MVQSVTLCSATLGEDGRREPPLGPLYIAAALEESASRSTSATFSSRRALTAFREDRWRGT